MTDNNSMGKIEYILSNIFWSFITMIWYRSLLFIPLNDYTVGTSKKVLWILIATMVLIGMLITFKKRRNYLSLVINILFPFEVYAITSYWNFFNTWVKATAFVASVLAILFFSLVVFRKISSRRKNKISIIKKRLKHAFLGARTIAVVCLCAFIIPLGVNAFIGRDLYQSNDGDTIVLNESDEWTIANNIDTVLKIKPDIWKTLSVEERLEVLSVLKNIEIRYLGINHEIHLSADNLEENTLGCYIPNERKIVIDVTHLKNDSVDSVVKSLIHEVHHAYSRQQVEVYKILPDEYKNMLMFYNAQLYEEEYANYIDGDDNYYGYATQYCERHADAYADDAVESFYKAVFEYETKGE